jgi:hypothetical protein
MTMPFGKFKGTPLTAINDHYLLWLATLDVLRDPLLSSVNAEMDRRIADARAGVAR